MDDALQKSMEPVYSSPSAVDPNSPVLNRPGRPVNDPIDRLEQAMRLLGFGFHEGMVVKLIAEWRESPRKDAGELLHAAFWLHRLIRFQGCEPIRNVAMELLADLFPGVPMTEIEAQLERWEPPQSS